MQPIATTQDLLRLAEAADEAQRGGFFAQAETAAASARDWQAIADAWALCGNVPAAQRCLSTALARSGHDVWDHRRAAATKARLGDLVGARTTLGTLEQALLARANADPLAWRLLAEGFAELHDLAGARRCLEAGRARAATADDHCAVAQGHAELLGDRATATLLVEQAQQLAMPSIGDREPDAFACWSVANAWERLAEQERASAVLAAGLQRSTSVANCLQLAQAWSSHDQTSGQHSTAVQRCIAKARALARSFADWFAVAEALRTCAGDPAPVRTSLLHAQALASTPAEQRKLAFAMSEWLGDAEAAKRLGPCGLTPAELAPVGLSPRGWQRDAGTLFDWLRGRVDVGVLIAISEADYGTETNQHFAALRAIWRDGTVPIPLEWHPREVLSLCQWAEGLEVDHRQRAFCCTLLCLAELADDRHGPGGIEDTFAILVESCLVLGPDALERLPGLLVAFLDGPANHDLGELALATLALLLVAASLDAHDQRLEPLAAQLLHLDAQFLTDGDYPHPEHGFVVGMTFHDQRAELWQRLVRETFATGETGASMPALAQVRRRLLGA